jgi:hypothetical protein
MNRDCTRDALLRELPSPWRKGALAIPVLTIDGPIGTVVSLDSDVLTVQPPTSPEPTAIPATQSLDAIRLACGNAGVGCALVDPTLAAVSGAVLLPFPETTVVATTAGVTLLPLFGWASPTWRLLDPLAEQLAAESVNVEVGLAQLNLLEAATSFADLWGTYLGIPRFPGEDDATYTARMRWWTIRPKENGYALAAALEEDFPPLKVTIVVDTVTECFIPSDDKPLRYRPLRGWHYNVATIDIITEGAFPSEDMANAAARLVACGIKVYLRGAFALTPMASPAGYDFAGTDCTVGLPLPIQINHAPPIGIGKIGPDPGDAPGLGKWDVAKWNLNKWGPASNRPT